MGKNKVLALWTFPPHKGSQTVIVLGGDKCWGEQPGKENRECGVVYHQEGLSDKVTVEKGLRNEGAS